MPTDPPVDLALHVVRTDAHVHGTVAGPAPIRETFDGWLDLTAAIVRALDAAAAPPAADQPSERPT